MRLTDFTVLIFECHGTLIDWESGMAEAPKPLVSRLNREILRDRV